MAYTYDHRTRSVHREVHTADLGMTNVSTTANTQTSTLNLPAGAWAIGLTVEVVANSAPIVVTAAPWVDHDQTVISPTNFKFLATGSATATTNISVAATASGGWSGVVVPAGDQYGAAAPVINVHGTQLTITCTAVTGAYEIAYTAVEL